MQVVIEISEERYNALCMRGVVVLESQLPAFLKALRNGMILPEGHGDLVDRDKVIDLLNEQEYNYYTELDKVCDTVYEAPIIIEADKGE